MPAPCRPQHPGTPDSCYVIVRGCENLPITVGAVTLPTTAKLTLHTIEEKLYKPLEWVPIVDLPTGDGLVSPFSPTRVWSASQPPSPTAAPVPPSSERRLPSLLPGFLAMALLPPIPPSCRTDGRGRPASAGLHDSARRGVRQQEFPRGLLPPLHPARSGLPRHRALDRDRGLFRLGV